MAHMNDTNIQSLRKSFESSYLEKDYARGIELLNKNPTLYPQGQFHYNIGTLHLKNGDHSLARFHLSKALQFRSMNSSALKNLKLAESYLQASTEKEVRSSFEQGILFLKEAPSASFYTLSLIFFIGSFYFIGKKGTRFFKSKSFYLSLVLALIPLSLKMFYLNQIDLGITTQAIKSFEGPSQIYSTSGEVPQGVKLLLKKGENGWYFIKSPGEFSGWIGPENLGIL